VSHRFRYLVTAGGSYAVTANSVIGALGTVCTVTNTTVRPFASSFRIKKITVWPSCSSAASQEVRIVWSNSLTLGFVRDSEIERINPEGVSVTAPAVFKPPKLSLAEFWQTGSGSTMFTVVAITAGSVIDFEVDFTLSNGFLSATQAVGTGTLGNVYYLYLDGSTSHNFVPLGIPATF
jgi:hypothetical protein